MADYVQVLTTTESREDAYRLAHQLLASEIAAVVQIIGPISSIYRAEAVEVEAHQWQLVIRTAAPHAPALVQQIRAWRTDGVADTVVTPILGGDADYLKWIDAQARITK